jgi:hypothetical protein
MVSRSASSPLFWTLIADKITDALKEKIGTLSIDKQEKLEAEAEKAEKKAEKKAETEKKKKAVSCQIPY